MLQGISQAPFSPTSLLEERATAPAAFLERVDFLRWDASRKMHSEKKVKLGQFLTPMPVAQLMASMVHGTTPAIHILDAGAGVGTLFAACVAELCQRSSPPQVITVTAYEIDESLVEYLHYTMDLCKKECAKIGVQFVGKVICDDFIENAVDLLTQPLFLTQPNQQYNCAILNPKSFGEERKLLRRSTISCPKSSDTMWMNDCGSPGCTTWLYGTSRTLTISSSGPALEVIATEGFSR